MNRNEFILKLNNLLADLSTNEREEAISYYEDYFDDAGPEAEQEVIRSLGSPERVAENIKSGLRGNEEGEFSERGYQTKGDNYKDEVMNRGMSAEERGFAKKNNISAGMLIIIILLCIILFPVVVPLATGLLGAVFGLLTAAVAIIFGIFVSGIVVGIVGLITFVVGIVKLVFNPALGVFLIGFGLLLSGLGALLTILGIWIVTKLLPPVIRGIVTGCKRMLAGRN